MSVDDLIVILSLAAWLGAGWVGWYNGHCHFRREYGDNAFDLAFTILLGPLNLITIAMFGWRIGA